MTQYMRAARLEPENYGYLIKAQRYAREAGKYDLSARIGEELLTVAEAEFGPESIETALALNGLANSYQLQSNHAAAEPLYERDLTISEKALGADHPEVAITLNNLAGLYYKLERHTDAEPLYRRALTILRARLGDDHPNTRIIAANFRTMLTKVPETPARLEEIEAPEILQ